MPTPTAAPTKTNGVLAINPAQPSSGGSARSSRRKQVAVGKKVTVRRLAPGMTEEEFWTILGDDWKTGSGKVDWARWENGKISKDPFKLSKPSRCYLRILKLEDVPVLSDIVRGKSWEDAKNTWNDACLVGPAYVEMAQIQKIATTKRRTDPRQGTIDQDPDFTAFLESLNNAHNPTKDIKESEEQGGEDASKEAKVTITPLVQYLKDKKANKAKEAAAAKSAKHGRQESAGNKSKGQEEASKKKGKDGKADRSDAKEKEKPKEPVKLLTKRAAQQEAAEAAKAVAAAKTSTDAKTAEAKEEPTPKSRRAGIAAAAKILQRDLGLSPGSAHRKARQDAAKVEVTPKAEPAKPMKEKESVSASTSTPTKPSASTSATAASSSRNPESQTSTPKAQLAENNRRTRGKGGKQNTSVADSGKGKEPATSSSKTAPAPPTPVILKREDNTKQASPATPTTTTSAATATPASQLPATVNKRETTKAGKAGNQQSQKKNAPAAGSRGFIKHANASQGITEALLKSAMEVFGSVLFVEIDKRKGFAYVDFVSQDSLAKAIAASPVSVAQGAVQVLERKDNRKAATPANAASPTVSSSASTSAPPAPDTARDKPAPAADKAAADKPTADGQTERPKRGGRGRGRKGGGNNNNGNANGGASKGAPSEGKAASAQSSTAAQSAG